MSAPLFRWPNNGQAAVSLTFDDGMASHLALAIPILNRYHFGGTFYLNPREQYAEQLALWRSAVADGHEIGNHTVTHPCSKNLPFISETGRQALEEMTLEEIEAEIVEAGRRIQEILPEQTAVSFAYPCYQPFVGRSENHRSYVPVVAKHCIAGRGRGERSNDPRYCDLAHLWSWPCERMSGPAMIGLIEQAASQGRWAVLTFHGILEGHLSVTETDFVELCRHLDANRSRFWCAPVATVAQYVSEWQTNHS